MEIGLERYADMSTSLYLLFDVATDSGASLARFVEGIGVPEYEFTDSPLKSLIQPPGEKAERATAMLYAKDYYRVFIGDSVIQFYREAESPYDIKHADQELQSALFAQSDFRLNRWLAVSEGWDDDDNRFERIIANGETIESLIAVQQEQSDF